MTSLRRTIAVALAFTMGAASFTFAQQLSPAEEAAARTKVQTAVTLAEIAEAEGDGDALLVAARLLSSVGAVARRGAGAENPALYSVPQMATAAKALGADGAKADALATTATGASPTSCYWYYNCDSNNNCVWQYIC